MLVSFYLFRGDLQQFYMPGYTMYSTLLPACNFLLVLFFICFRDTLSTSSISGQWSRGRMVSCRRLENPPVPFMKGGDWTYHRVVVPFLDLEREERS